MCAQFIVKGHLKDLEKFYGISVPETWSKSVNVRVLPHQQAPVIVASGEALNLVSMSFSLIPSWSKTRRVKFATHNARLETVAEKPTWRRPFAEAHCVVPMTFFVEPIYTGEYAGHMVAFSEKQEAFLLAAGVWDSWVDPETGEVLDSFAILTDTPNEFVAHTGHDRMPLFLDPSHVPLWLKAKDKAPGDWLSFLKAHRATLGMKVKKDRAMRPGWEKRA
ncbi:MAG: SOS response-associated peptidase family protein [Pseudobdellovibrionaceae bacterium]|nr:SOS response-associated peptidase family protein [Bdellovibrionales bacterium]USN47366.1 MAG: SOS response-associated peptidase family protein [Pseudobdellovibrionaceae bacterium]